MSMSVSWTFTLSQLDVRYAQIADMESADSALSVAIGNVDATLTGHLGSGNPHSVTKADIGLNNVANVAQIPTSDRKQAVAASTTDVPSMDAVIDYVQATTDVLDPIVAAIVFGGE